MDQGWISIIDLVIEKFNSCPKTFGHQLKKNQLLTIFFQIP
jgi:hypothetical protein